jgi:hypothetical protein
VADFGMAMTLATAAVMVCNRAMIDWYEGKERQDLEENAERMEIMRLLREEDIGLGVRY